MDDIDCFFGVELFVEKMKRCPLPFLFNIQTEDPSELLLKLQSRVSTSPESKCTLVSGCMNQVKPGFKNVYPDV